MLLATILFSCANVWAQSGYIVDPATKKRVTYEVRGNTIYYSNGRTAVPSLASTDFKLAYLNATLPPVTSPEVVKEVTLENGKQILLGKLSNVTVKIKPGTYTGIWLYLEQGSNVKIDATGVTFKNSSMDFGPVQGFELFGASFIDQSYRSIQFNGLSSDVKLHDLSFRNIGDYVITYKSNTRYDGTDATISKNWTLERLSFVNTSQGFSSDGRYEDDGIYGLTRNFKFLNNSVKDCPQIGTVVWVGAAEDFEISGNTIDHINYVFSDPKAPNGYHWGVFAMYGNGSFHDNKVTNHSGNLLRAWTASFGQATKELLIYNNIAFNSHKYGAFEIQLPPWMMEYADKFPTRLKAANARVYNNTAGQMNTVREWEGQLLDLYNTRGTLYYFNNLGFNLNSSQRPVTNMINNMSDVVIYRNDGNVYKPTWEEAVSDTNNLKSKFQGIGAQ